MLNVKSNVKIHVFRNKGLWSDKCHLQAAETNNKAGLQSNNFTWLLIILKAKQEH